MPMGRPMRLLHKTYTSRSLQLHSVFGGCEKTSRSSPWPVIKLALLVSMITVGVERRGQSRPYRTQCLAFLRRALGIDVGVGGGDAIDLYVFRRWVDRSG